MRCSRALLNLNEGIPVLHQYVIISRSQAAGYSHRRHLSTPQFFIAYSHPLGLIAIVNVIDIWSVECHSAIAPHANFFPFCHIQDQTPALALTLTNRRDPVQPKQTYETNTPKTGDRGGGIGVVFFIRISSASHHMVEVFFFGCFQC